MINNVIGNTLKIYRKEALKKWTGSRQDTEMSQMTKIYEIADVSKMIGMYEMNEIPQINDWNLSSAWNECLQ